MSKEAAGRFAIEYLKDSGMAVNFVLSRDDLEAVVRKMVREAMEDARSTEGTGLVTREEACGMLGVSPSTLWKWDKTGYLKKRKVGRSVFYEKKDILALANND